MTDTNDLGRCATARPPRRRGPRRGRPARGESAGGGPPASVALWAGGAQAARGQSCPRRRLTSACMGPPPSSKRARDAPAHRTGGTPATAPARQSFTSPDTALRDGAAARRVGVEARAGWVRRDGQVILALLRGLWEAWEGAKPAAARGAPLAERTAHHVERSSSRASLIGVAIFAFGCAIPDRTVVTSGLRGPFSSYASLLYGQDRMWLCRPDLEADICRVEHDPVMRGRLLVAMPIGGPVDVPTGRAVGGTFDTLSLSSPSPRRRGRGSRASRASRPRS